MREKNPAFPFDNIKNIDHWCIWGGGGVAGSIAIPVVSEVKIKLQYCYTVTHSCAMVSYNQWQIEGAEPPPPPQYC